jgi:hypothetical protein
MAHLHADLRRSDSPTAARRTDPVVALLFAVLASVVVALALTERFAALVPALLACAAAWGIARLEARTR